MCSQYFPPVSMFRIYILTRFLLFTHLLLHSRALQAQRKLPVILVVLLKSAVPTCIRLSAIYPDDRVIRAIWYTVIRLYYHSPNEFFYFVYTLILRFFSVFPTGYMLHCKYKKRRGRSMRNYINTTIHSHLIHPQKPRPFSSSTACQKLFFLCFHSFLTIIKQLTAAEHRLSAVRTALFLLHPFLRMIRNSGYFYLLIKTTAEQEHHRIISLKYRQQQEKERI